MARQTLKLALDVYKHLYPDLDDPVDESLRVPRIARWLAANTNLDGLDIPFLSALSGLQQSIDELRDSLTDLRRDVGNLDVVAPLAEHDHIAWVENTGIRSRVLEAHSGITTHHGTFSSAEAAIAFIMQLSAGRATLQRLPAGIVKGRGARAHGYRWNEFDLPDVFK